MAFVVLPHSSAVAKQYLGMPQAGIPSQPSWVKSFRCIYLKHQKIMKYLFHFIWDVMMEHRLGQVFEGTGILQCCTPKFSPAASPKALLGEFQPVISVTHRHYHSLSPKNIPQNSGRTPELKHTPAQPPQTLPVHGAGPAPPGGTHRTWDSFGLLGI